MEHYNAPKRKRRDSDDCCSSVNLVKSMLHIFNVVFMLSGGAVLGVAVWTIFWKFQYVSLLPTLVYIVGIYAFAVAGLLAIIGGILGCFGVFYEQRAILLCYTFLLVLVFLLEAVVGGLAYVYETQIDEELQRNLNATFLTSYGVDEMRTNAIDRMQQNYVCCGAVRFEDWQASVWASSDSKDLLRSSQNRRVPDSCCFTFSDGCGKRDHPSNIPYTGCIYRLGDEMRKHLTIVGAVGLGICLIQIIGMILSCCLYIRLKDPDD